MPFKVRWGAICMAATVIPLICCAVDPVPPSPLSAPPDAMAQARAAIHDAMARTERMSATLDSMTTTDVYDFYTRRNDLYKNGLMRAVGAYDALSFINDIATRYDNSRAGIMDQLRTEADPVARQALIARLPEAAIFSRADADAAIRTRIGALEAESARLTREEDGYQAALERIRNDINALARDRARNAAAIAARVQERWAVLARVEAIHRDLMRASMERDALRDYAKAADKGVKESGIARRVISDLRIFVDGMRVLGGDIQTNIAANRAAQAMPAYQPGQAFFLNRLGAGDAANPLASGLSVSALLSLESASAPSPLSAPADMAPPPLSVPVYVPSLIPGTDSYLLPAAIIPPARPTAPRSTGPRRLPPPRTPRLR